MSDDLVERVAQAFCCGGKACNAPSAEACNAHIFKEGARDAIAVFSAERDALRAQLDEAREALEPFAEIADIYEIDALSVGDLETFIDVVDLRRARAVLEKIKGGGQGDA